MVWSVAVWNSTWVFRDNLQIQWYRNGQAIDGANSARFIIGELTAEDAGVYSVAISNGAVVLLVRMRWSTC